MTPRLLVIAFAVLAARPPLAVADKPDGLTVYRQAMAAFQANDMDEALVLAMRAAQLPGPQRDDARFLYADALFRTGQYTRAKDIYVALSKTLLGDRRAIAVKKIAAANKRLALPDDDSTVTPPPSPAPIVLPSAKPNATGDELYRQAVAAFQTNDMAAARALATKAVMVGGLHKTDAKVLYGDTLFRDGEYARAKEIYIGLRRSTTGDVRAIMTRKITAANTAMQLPETDGITD
jgi:thioredoxin-like negative regulator of GroEL